MTAVNFGQMTQRIKDEVNRPSTSNDAFIQDAILTAIRFYTGKPFYFLEAQDSVTLLDGDTDVALPSDFGSLYKLRLLDDTTYYTDTNGIELMTISELVDAVSVLQPGRPTRIAIWDETLYTDYEAQDDYDIDLWYYQKDATLPSADGDTSVFFDDGQDLIRNKAIEYFYRDRLHDNTSGDIYEQKAMTFYNQLTARQAYQQRWRMR